MHELSLCIAMVDMLSARLSAEGGQRVLRIEVVIGALGCVESEALAFSFSSAARGTPLEDAELKIHLQPASALCMDCQRQVAINQHLDPCPECGSEALQIQGGDELRVTAMEII